LLKQAEVIGSYEVCVMYPSRGAFVIVLLLFSEWAMTGGAVVVIENR